VSGLPCPRTRLLPPHAHLPDHAPARHAPRRLRETSVHRYQPFQGDERGQGPCACQDAQGRRAALHAAGHDRGARRDRRNVRRRSLALRRRGQPPHARGARSLHGRAVADQGAHSRRPAVRANLRAITARWCDDSRTLSRRSIARDMERGMKLASYMADGKAGFGVVTGDGVVTLTQRLGYATLRAALTAGGLAEIRKAADAAKPDRKPADVKWLPVIPSPDKILCAGINYRSHAAE